jgi:hypothetical protein
MQERELNYTFRQFFRNIADTSLFKACMNITVMINQPTMQQSPSWQGNIRSANYDIPCLFITVLTRVRL